jgi:hypothetical protein
MDKDNTWYLCILSAPLDFDKSIMVKSRLLGHQGE